MKIRQIAGLAMFAAIGAPGAQPGSGARAITIYVDKGSIPAEDVAAAEWRARRMFAAIGVRTDWDLGKPRKAVQSDVILIELVQERFVSNPPGPLGLAWAESGTIRIFYDRIIRWTEGERDNMSNHSPRQILLANVLAHEVTHVLEGVPHHSAEGLMKADWGAADYRRMISDTLRFAPEDVELINHGLQARAARPEGTQMAWNRSSTPRATETASGGQR